MLVFYDVMPFVPWCQVNALLTRPKHDSNLHRVIMDLSWPYPPRISASMAAHRTDVYRGSFKKCTCLWQLTWSITPSRQERAVICTAVILHVPFATLH